MNAIVSRVASLTRLPAMPWRRWRLPALGSEQLALVASVYFAAACNTTFFGAVIQSGGLHGAHGWWTGVALFVAIVALHFLLLCVLFTRWTAKPVLVALLLTSALAVHFMRDYTVYFDTDMIRNILHTDPDESGELVNAGLLPSFLLLGVLPSMLAMRVRLRRRSWRRAAWIRVLSMALALGVASLALLSSFQSVSSLMRNHRELRHLVTPGNYLVSALRVATERPSRPKGPREPVGLQAKVVGRPAGTRPRVLVLVVGETLRAQNWGLNGYARDTTPALRRIDPVNFPDVTACGSNTEVSLPCMFSDIGRANYDKRRIEARQSLLDVLDHAGVDTRWIDNQSGCKHVCDGVAHVSVSHARDPVLCTGDRCLDGILVDALSGALGDTTEDRVIVLHMLGNHGPAYFNRYPRDARAYSPECRSEELAHCSREEIVNAYDNAVRYTDSVLARLVATLQADADVDSALVYVSDHGESLGEDGVYLHGLPYSIAPRTQVRVPMVMWFSPGMQASRGLDLQCLREVAGRPASHDNLFSSVLGLMQVQTPEYRPDLDLFRPCLPATGA
ncbi:phosphoethanolamine transferase [Marilutibacter spongiae]|uniref:Phosphoethanolamine transferase n=1 Tax=Marilutibacter spongiae TaxID=2025720 RepID=A0A7W3Y5L2_9GAMM|nr:phosphoethanolamine--lipid A transferase [Lysobacter spongiae]MBB1060016.1 phosphoethanolamine transferase [Lysobacter spongiae]